MKYATHTYMRLFLTLCIAIYATPAYSAAFNDYSDDELAYPMDIESYLPPLPPLLDTPAEHHEASSISPQLDLPHSASPTLSSADQAIAEEKPTSPAATISAAFSKSSRKRTASMRNAQYAESESSDEDPAHKRAKTLDISGPAYRKGPYKKDPLHQKMYYHIAKFPAGAHVPCPYECGYNTSSSSMSSRIKTLKLHLAKNHHNIWPNEAPAQENITSPYKRGPYKKKGPHKKDPLHQKAYYHVAKFADDAPVLCPYEPCIYGYQTNTKNPEQRTSLIKLHLMRSHDSIWPTDMPLKTATPSIAPSSHKRESYSTGKAYLYVKKFAPDAQVPCPYESSCRYITNTTHPAQRANLIKRHIKHSHGDIWPE